MSNKDKYKKLLEAKEIVRELCEEFDLFPYDLYYETTENLKQCAAWVDENLLLKEERKELEAEEENKSYPFDNIKTERKES